MSTRNAERIINAAATEIVRPLWDVETSKWRSGRIQVQMMARYKGDYLPKRGESPREKKARTSNSKRRRARYRKMLRIIGLDERNPSIALEYLKGGSDIILLPGGRCVNSYSFITMMLAWVCTCVGCSFDEKEGVPQVAHNAEELSAIRDCFKMDNDGDTPEERGFSPRAGAIVAEFVNIEYDNVVLQISIACLSALGAEEDMRMAELGLRVIAAHLRRLLRGRYSMRIGDRYPSELPLKKMSG